MGNRSSSMRGPPVPVSVTVVHPDPDTYPVAGYVAANDYKLTYTLLQGRNDTVAGLLQLMGQHGPENGTGVRGVSATVGAAALGGATPLVDGVTVYLVFGAEVNRGSHRSLSYR